MKVIRVVKRFFVRLTNRRRIKGSKNKISISIHAWVRNCSFHIEGDNNRITVSDGCQLEGVVFFLKGNSIQIEFGKSVFVGNGSVLWAEDDNGTISIENGSVLGGVHLAVTEGKSIYIGEDCMFSDDIDVRTGDSHSIVDIHTGDRLNQASDVKIGNHVWCCAHSSILKGSAIPDGIIIGTRSVITSSLQVAEGNVIMAGAPAKVLKQGVSWKPERI